MNVGVKCDLGFELGARPRRQHRFFARVENKAVAALAEIKPTRRGRLGTQRGRQDFQRIIGRARRHVGANEPEIHIVAVQRTARLKPEHSLEARGD